MAVYFHGNPEIQVPDGLQTLVLMNPNYVQYSDTPTPQTNNLVFLNSSSTSAHALHSPHSQQLVGIPLSAAATPAAQDSLHGLVQRVHYNLYNPIDPSVGARETPRAQQGLSLSLSSQQQPSNYGPAAAEDIRVAAGWASSGSGVTNGASGMHGVLLSSKYLKVAQELLDEVVNVNNNCTGIDNGPELVRKGSGNNRSSSKAIRESSGGAADGGEAAGKRSVDLSTAERQEIQMKKAKLINMLDEVEQRYKQYHQQMQMVISTFEQAAGIGTARTYTALALKTISRQFRCLKDAITGQIRACSKSLGEEDTLGVKIEGSRLKFVDNHFRQQRALQQLGMIQHNAWRPQRGLPERSVSVLRAWLFEHFLHPYPKDSDKQMLAKQTGLTRSQVSNWFINARVRLWKPMVEEMYLEEIKEQEQSGAISDDKTSRSLKNEDTISSKATSFSPSTLETKAKQNMMNHNAGGAAAISMSTASTAPNIAGHQSGFSLIDMEGMTTSSPKRLRTSNDMLRSPGASMSSINMEMKQSEQRLGRDGYSFMGSHSNLMGSFGQYQMAAADMAAGRFDETEHHQQFTPRFSGNGVSLTLGLPHCDNLSLSGARHHQGFLQNPNVEMGRQMSHEFGAMNSSTPHHSSTAAAFEIQNGKRFAAQLLHDFVA